MTDYTARDDAPETCPFESGKRFRVTITEAQATDLGNVLISEGDVTWAWMSGGSIGYATVWTPGHYASVEWSSIPARAFDF